MADKKAAHFLFWRCKPSTADTSMLLPCWDKFCPLREWLWSFHELFIFVNAVSTFISMNISGFTCTGTVNTVFRQSWQYLWNGLQFWITISEWVFRINFLK
jgi:hypothetical protein